MNCHFLIVGSGCSGAVVARLLKDAGYDVLVVERRNHIGGNAYDYHHPSGIIIHKYGPHFFRTDNDAVWRFMTKFDDFYGFAGEVLTNIDGKLEHWPVWSDYIEKSLGRNAPPPFTGEVTNLEEACLASMPRLVYEKFIREYNIKQWGCDPKLIESHLASRFEIRRVPDPRLKCSKHQGLPLNGFACWFGNMLKDIPVLLNVDYLKDKTRFKVSEKVIYTGPIDEFFNYKFGTLAYRAQRRRIVYKADIDWFQPTITVNYPSLKQGAKIRILEWKHLMHADYAKRISGTAYTIEEPFTPANPNDYEYPFPDKINAILYKRYKGEAEKMRDVIFIGRLAQYSYIDMDKAIENAFSVANEIFR